MNGVGFSPSFLICFPPVGFTLFKIDSVYYVSRSKYLLLLTLRPKIYAYALRAFCQATLTDMKQFLGGLQQHLDDVRYADALGDVLLLRLGVAGQRPQCTGSLLSHFSVNVL